MALAMAWSGVTGPASPHLLHSRQGHRGSKDQPPYRTRGGAPTDWISDGIRLRPSWGALDPGTDVLYLYGGEYWGEADPAIHAAAIQAHGDWIPGVIDPTSNGRNQMDGERLMQIYRKHRLHLQAVDSQIESGILEVCQRMSSGRLKVFASLAEASGGAQTVPPR